MPGEDSNYKLIYFGTRGLAEPIRLIFQYNGVPFENYMIPKDEPDFTTWKALKPKMPYGTVPVLEFASCEGDNCELRQLGQSHTICRYLGKKFGLAGKDDWEQANVDALAEWFKDIWHKFLPFLMVAMDIKEGDKKKLYDEEFVPLVYESFVPIINGKLKESASGYLMSFGLTWIDFIIAEVITTFNNYTEGELAKKHPNLIEYARRVYSANEFVKKYVDAREFKQV